MYKKKKKKEKRFISIDPDRAAIRKVRMKKSMIKRNHNIRRKK